jgi:hypothetical protein
MIDLPGGRKATMSMSRDGFGFQRGEFVCVEDGAVAVLGHIGAPGVGVRHDLAGFRVDHGLPDGLAIACG